MEPEVLAAEGEWQPAMPGITKRTLEGGRMTYIRYRFEPEAVFPLHRHGQEQLVILGGGSARCEIENSVTEMQPGEAIFIPFDAPHRITAGADGALIHCVLSPRRTAETNYELLESDATEGKQKRTG